MFSKVLVKLIGVFLILCISLTSATPAGKAQNTSDDTQSLAPRTNILYQCPTPYIWKRRECIQDGIGSSPRNWQDVCSSPSGMEYKNQPGMCSEHTFCIDRFLHNKQPAVACVPLAISKGKQRHDIQSGSSEQIVARKQANTQFQHPVTIDHDMSDASVSAILKSECRTQAVNVRCHHMFLCSSRESIESR